MNLVISKKFEREFQKFSSEIKIRADEIVKILENNVNDSRLHLHKLHGPLKDYWSVRVNFQIRILIQIGDDDTIVLCRIGDHSLYE